MIVVVLLAAFGMMLTGCDGGTFLISKDQEIEIGQDAAAEFDREHRVDRSSADARWLQRIGDRVAAAAQPPNYPYQFTLVKEDVDNAFALPGGPIYFYEGLIETLGRDEDQVAWVIGHEITHIRQKHAIKRIERAIGAQLLIEWALGGGSGADIAAAVTGLSLQHYTRENEHQADRHGVMWTAAAGYDPSASLKVLEAFQEIQGRDPNDFEILFMSHPGNNDRSNAVKRFMDKENLSGRYYTAGTGG